MKWIACQTIRNTALSLRAACLSLALGAGLAAAHATPAADPAPASPAPEAPKVALYPGKAPESLGETVKDAPFYQVYLPPADKANGAAVLVCPGGGYRGLAMNHEGKLVAEWLNSIGVAGFVLRYRLPGDGYKHPHPLADAQRALRLIRSKAEEYKIDPARVGVMGFSAGGHLASTLGTLFAQPQNFTKDAVDQLSARPDFLILVYPCISTTQPFKYGGMPVLPKDAKDPAQVKALSSEFNVTKETPPTFLVHSDADGGVSPLNSVAFYTALKENKVPAELHIYDGGGHGWGMNGVGKSPNAGARTWTDRLAEWLKQRGFFAPAAAVPAAPAPAR